MRECIGPVVLAATLLVGATSVCAEAQGASRSPFGVSAGIAVPLKSGTISDFGFHVGGRWQGGSGDAGMLRLDADFGRYGTDASNGTSTVTGTFTLLGAMANLVLPLKRERAHGLYVLGGAGAYHWEDELGAVGPVDGTVLAFNIGAGFDFSVGKKAMFAEVRYLSIQWEGDPLRTMPFVIGLRF